MYALYDHNLSLFENLIKSLKQNIDVTEPGNCAELPSSWIKWFYGPSMYLCILYLWFKPSSILYL